MRNKLTLKIDEVALDIMKELRNIKNTECMDYLLTSLTFLDEAKKRVVQGISPKFENEGADDGLR